MGDAMIANNLETLLPVLSLLIHRSDPSLTVGDTEALLGR